MGCHRCGAREVDPVRGPSPWKRGVIDGRQVLVCPDCQHGRDWRADLDRCAECASTALVRRLGEITCRSCGHLTAAPQETRPAPSDGSELRDEVAAALDRLFGRLAGPDRLG